MRKQFVKSATALLTEDPKTVVLLGDIGVFGFRQAAEQFPDRVYNVGILEQATVGMAAGMAIAGMNPIVHTIAPFLVDRAYEQLKIDFGYQRLKGTFVSVGGSFDYTSLGCTHHCPGDINLIENIDGFSIFVPGHPAELEMIFQKTKSWGGSRYIRLSEHSNTVPYQTDIMKPVYIRRCNDHAPTVLAVGPCMDMVLEAAKGLAYNIAYTCAVKPFAAHEFFHHNPNIVIVEPYYSSQLGARIAGCNVSEHHPVNIRNFSLPRRFIDEYGDRNRISLNLGFYARALRCELERWIPKSPTLSEMMPRA